MNSISQIQKISILASDEAELNQLMQEISVCEILFKYRVDEGYVCLVKYPDTSYFEEFQKEYVKKNQAD